MRDVRGVNVAEALAANIDNLSIRKHAWRPVSHIGDRNTATNHAVRKLRLRRRRQPFVHRSALVRFKVSKGQPAQFIDWDNFRDSAGYKWKHLSAPAVKQQRLIAEDQKMIVSEAGWRSDFRHEYGEPIYVGTNLVDFSFHRGFPFHTFEHLEHALYF
jgi:hypothetical protein